MSIENRLHRLERENRIHRGLWGLAVLIGVALVVWGQAQPIPDVIRARAFQVVNEEGKTVGEMSYNARGGQFFINSNVQQLMAVMQVGTRGGRLVIANKAKMVDAIRIGVDTGGGFLEVHNNDGEMVDWLGIYKFGHGILQVCDRSGRKCKAFQYAP